MNTILLSCVAVAVALFVCGNAISVDRKSRESDPITSYYGYITINKTYDSAMFYAIRTLGYSTNTLVLFLQGGPGVSSLFSDYLETGPQQLVADNDTWYTISRREYTWADSATMLYVDNPVGTGFSYSNDPRGLSTTDEEVAENLLIFMKRFYEKHPEYKKKKFLIVGESYGGKMAAYFGARLAEEIKKKTMNVTFLGIGLGDAWIDPIGCMYSYADYLTSLGQCSKDEEQVIRRLAAGAQSALEAGDGNQATRQWGKQQQYISNITSNLNWYNIQYYYDYIFTAEYQLRVFLTTKFLELPEVKKANIKHKYGSQNDAVFSKMSKTFMRDAITKVDYLLAEGYNVSVYNGQYDLIVNQVCTSNWVKKLQWENMMYFNKQIRRYKILERNIVSYYFQWYNNFLNMFVNKAGHMVPRDQAKAGTQLFNKIIYGATLEKESVSSSLPKPNVPKPNRAVDIYMPQQGIKKIDDVEFVALP